MNIYFYKTFMTIYMDVGMYKCKGGIQMAKFSRTYGLKGLMAEPRKEIRDP